MESEIEEILNKFFSEEEPLASPTLEEALAIAANVEEELKNVVQ